jgi:hypothetical protein
MKGRSAGEGTRFTHLLSAAAFVSFVSAASVSAAPAAAAERPEENDYRFVSVYGYS